MVLKPVCFGLNLDGWWAASGGEGKGSASGISKCKPALILAWSQNVHYLYRIKTKNVV